MNQSHQVCNIDYDNELNTRMNKRYFPSQELAPNFDPRPVSTKYSHFMIQDPPKESSVNLRVYPEYRTHQVFYTGTAKAPVQHALQQVDVESALGNRFLALQKNDHAFYIPPLQSDLYNQNSSLRDKPKTSEFVFNPPMVKNVDRCNLAPRTFNNSTRYNLKNLSI